MGEPAATLPTKGTSTARPNEGAMTLSIMAVSSEGCMRAIERDFNGSRLIKPFSSRALRCTCTVEGEESPKLWQISRTVGP